MIPKQLTSCKFCRIKKKTKKPFELAWQMLESEYKKQINGTWKNEKNELYMVKIKGKKERVPYTGEIHNYNHNQISQHIPQENYGILTGVNNLAVLDDDTADKALMKIFFENFGETFRVRNHYYSYIKGMNKKLIFYNKDDKHCGEMQWKGQQVVGPGSVHPSGAIYDIKNNKPIIEVDYIDLINVFKDYLPKTKKRIVTKHRKSKWKGNRIQDIPISNIISLVGLTNKGGGCYQGPHPKHGSTHGENFFVDTLNNSWVCFRCNKKNHRGGGGPAELIAVMEDILSCSEVGQNCFTEEQFIGVIRIAREKYGLKVSATDLLTFQPAGWALSINIKKLAEKHNLLNCPTCHSRFSFSRRLGFYSCKKCKVRGGIKKFAELILKNNISK